MNLTIEQTCEACPESYDVFIDGECVGDLRLRHGQYTATCNGEVVYKAYPKGDGVFEYDEREKYILEGLKAISHYQGY